MDVSLVVELSFSFWWWHISLIILKIYQLSRHGNCSLVQLCLGLFRIFMGKHVHPSCSLLWQNSKTFIFSLFFKTTHQSGCWRLIFAFQKVVLKLQFVLVCISVSTVIAGSALATEHVGESSWVWLQCGGRCVGLSLRVWGAHDPGGKDP